MAFDFENEILIQNGETAEIARFEVQFATPFGCYSTLKDAKEKCTDLDMDATLVIQPVVVIIDKAGRSEILVRR